MFLHVPLFHLQPMINFQQKLSNNIESPKVYYIHYMIHTINNYHRKYHCLVYHSRQYLKWKILVSKDVHSMTIRIMIPYIFLIFFSNKKYISIILKQRDIYIDIVGFVISRVYGALLWV